MATAAEPEKLSLREAAKQIGMVVGLAPGVTRSSFRSAVTAVAVPLLVLALLLTSLT